MTWNFCFWTQGYVGVRQFFSGIILNHNASSYWPMTWLDLCIFQLKIRYGKNGTKNSTVNFMSPWETRGTAKSEDVWIFVIFPSSVRLARTSARTRPSLSFELFKTRNFVISKKNKKKLKKYQKIEIKIEKSERKSIKIVNQSKKM